MPSDVLRFPSDEFPTLPSISLALPINWSGAQVSGTLLAAHKNVDEGEFASNVIVRSQRVGSEVDLPAAARIVDEGISGLQDVQEIGKWLVKSGRLEGYATEFAFRDEQAGTLAQSWRVFVVAQGRVADLVEVVGSVSPARKDDFMDLRKILDSIEITI